MTSYYLIYLYMFTFLFYTPGEKNYFGKGRREGKNEQRRRMNEGSGYRLPGFTVRHDWLVGK